LPGLAGGGVRGRGEKSLRFGDARGERGGRIPGDIFNREKNIALAGERRCMERREGRGGGRGGPREDGLGEAV